MKIKIMDPMVVVLGLDIHGIEGTQLSQQAITSKGIPVPYTNL